MVVWSESFDRSLTWIASSNIGCDFVILCCVGRGIAMCRLSMQGSCEVSELTGPAQTTGSEDEQFLLIVCIYEFAGICSRRNLGN